MRETVRCTVIPQPAPEGGYMVSFGYPEALTRGETVAEAMGSGKRCFTDRILIFILKITSLSLYLRH